MMRQLLRANADNSVEYIREVSALLGRDPQRLGGHRPAGESVALGSGPRQLKQACYQLHARHQSRTIAAAGT